MSGILQAVAALKPSGYSIDYLVVAGGAGGAYSGGGPQGGGGGGAGGYRAFTGVTVNSGVGYTATIGGGGARGARNGVTGSPGAGSSFI